MSKKRNRFGSKPAGPPPKKKKITTGARSQQQANKPAATTPAKKTTTAKPQQSQQNKPIIPFVKDERVLLVGEGDFSFAQSLLQHHTKHITSICATCYDSREELLEKYEQAEEYIDALMASKQKTEETKAAAGQEEDEIDDARSGDRYSDHESDLDSSDEPGQSREPAPIDCTVLYSIDATKLHTYKSLKRKKFTRIIFNFPHVGGKSTDVNRQVRYNQALLHDFFNATKSLLDTDGTVIVTLFDGVPYTLWNVRDLARSAGLLVRRSWAFRSDVYPGYQHARTLGNLREKERKEDKHDETKHDDQVEVDDDSDAENDKEGDDWSGLSDDAEASAAKGEQPADHSAPIRPGRWRGEDRPARTYEFGLAPPPKVPEPEPPELTGANAFEVFVKKKKKRSKGKLHDEEASSEEEK